MFNVRRGGQNTIVWLWLALAALCGSTAVAGCGNADRPDQPGAARQSGGSTAAAPATAPANGPASTSTPPASTPFPRTVRDAFGDPLTLNAPPRRVVSQTLGTDEILFAICPRDRIAGISEVALNRTYSHIADEAKASGVKTIYGPEDILALKPELVFIASYTRAEMATLLRAARAPVYRFSNFDRIEDIASNVRALGYLIGEDAAAERVVTDMNERLTRARARAAASGRRPRIMSYDGSGYTAGGVTLFDDVIRQAGGVNVSAEHGMKGFGRVSGEQILEWQPDYLVCGAKPGEEEIVRRRLMDNPAIASSKAVKAGHLILMDTRDFLTTSHHVVNAVESLVDALYGAAPAAPVSAPSSAPAATQPPAKPTSQPPPEAAR
jgi:iron complex transport system substrate-binding protein